MQPCIWPLLPIVLSSSVLGGHRRPLGLTLGILLSFGIITLSISYLVKLIGFDANAGGDVKNGFIPVTSDRLYELINLGGNRGERLLRIEFSPGIQIFAFTFG